MVDLSVNYLGLKLRNPIIAGSSGLTNSIRELKEIEEQGAAAVVLKSIFEEQIRHEADKMMKEGSQKMDPMQKGFDDIMGSRPYDYDQALEYISSFAKEHSLSEYLRFVEEAKKNLGIPVIASINCVTPYDWSYFARRLQASGADALELNIYILPSDPHKKSADNEQIFLDIIKAVKSQVGIPVAVKLSYYFSGLAHTFIEFSNTGIGGMVLFNRPFHPDINIDTFEVTAEHIFSEPQEYSHALRWIAILAGRVGCDLVASTGIHDHSSVIKQLLAGATAVQMVSAYYKYGFSRISQTISGLEQWMKEKSFESIPDFRGKLSQVNIENPAQFDRVQFMKLYSKIH